MIRMTTDRIGGTTYTFANLTAFLANQPSTIQYLGDVSAPSVFNNGATGERHPVQEYYIGYAQDEWRVKPNFTLNYGVRYDYYTPLRERDNNFIKFNIDTGVLDPTTTPFFQSKKNNFQPRVSFTWAPTDRTAVKAGGGIFVGPGQTEDQIQPIESDRISSTLSSGRLPGRSDRAPRQFHQQPEQPVVSAARLRQRIHHPGADLSVHRIGAAGSRRELLGDGRLRRQPGPQPVPAQRGEQDHAASSRTRTRPRRPSSSASSRS